MIEKIKKAIGRKESFSFILSILLPISLMFIVYYRMGIYLGSEKTILASDAFPQLANFHASFHNVLHGKQNIFYTWYGSLGLNYWSLSAYYLNGIFTPLVYFFDNSMIPDTLYLITLLKFGAIGGAFWIFGQQTFKLSTWLITGLSVSYALMGFTVAYSPMLMWMDAMMYLPLVILGIHRLMDKQKPNLLFFSYLLLFLSNFYMAFMVGVFSFLYFSARVLTKPSVYKKSISRYLITSILAGGASMITILPALMDLSSNGETLSEIGQWLTPDTGPWDLIFKSMVGVYDTAKYESAPFIYIGILPLLFFIFYFFNRRIPRKNKLLYGGLTVLLILSVYIEPLNLFWHGFHAPNMLLFRFSFLLSFLVLLLAGYSLEGIEKKDLNVLVNIMIGLIVVFVAAFLLANKKKYNYISGQNLIWTIGFLLIYVVFWAVYFSRPKAKTSRFFLVLMLLLIVETGINSQAMINGVAKDWSYPMRAGYDKNFDEIQTLVDKTKSENQSLYRMANLDPMNINESFNFGYSGISMFSSIRNRHSSMYLNNLGFRSEGTNLVIEYANNTIIMDSLLGIRYNLAKEDPMKFGFEKEARQNELGLYRNKYALPLGILTDEGIYEESVMNNQTELLNYLAEKKTAMISTTEPKEQSLENVIVESDDRIVTYSEETPGADKVFNWTVSVPAHTQAYLSLFAVNNTFAKESKAVITVNGITREQAMKKVNQYYNLGYYEEATAVPVKVVFKGTPVVQILQPDVLLLNTEAFESAITAIQKKGVDFQTTGRTAKAKVDLDEEQVVLTTIPYDKGWTAKIDGKKIPISAFKEAFVTVKVPKGKHQIELRFLPQGFVTGGILFVSCLLLFLLYTFFIGKRTNLIN